MNHVKTYLGHLILYVVGGVDFVSMLPVGGALAPYAPYITAAGILSGLAHHSYKSGAAAGIAQAALDAAKAAAAAQTIARAAFLALMLPLLLAIASIQGCATVPTSTEQSVTAAAVTVATGLAIQQKDTDPQIWAKRAKEIKLIALELQSVNNAGNATLATLAADLQPQIQKLGPADVIAVNALVATLQPMLNQQIANNPKVGNTQVAVANILAAVLTACTAYGA